MNELQELKELNVNNKKFKFLFTLLILLLVITPLTHANKYILKVQEDLPWDYKIKQNIMDEKILEITFNNNTDRSITSMKGQIRFKSGSKEALTDWIDINKNLTMNPKGSETIEIKIHEKLLFLKTVKLLNKDIDNLIKKIKFIDFRYKHLRIKNSTIFKQDELYLDYNRENEYPNFFENIDKPFVNPRKVIKKYKNRYPWLSSIPQNDIRINIKKLSSDKQLMYLNNINHTYTMEAEEENRNELYVIIEKKENKIRIKDITDHIPLVFGLPQIEVINLSKEQKAFCIYWTSPTTIQGYFIINNIKPLLSLSNVSAVRAFRENNLITVQSQNYLKQNFKAKNIKVVYDNYQKLLDLGFRYDSVDNRILSSYQLKEYKWDQHKEQFKLKQQNNLPTAINIMEKFIKHIKKGNFNKALECLSPNFQKSLNNKGENLKAYLEKKLPGLLNSQNYFYIGDLKIIGIEDRNIYKFRTRDFNLRLFKSKVKLLDSISYDYQEKWSNMDKDYIDEIKIINDISRNKVKNIKELIYNE